MRKGKKIDRRQKKLIMEEEPTTVIRLEPLTKYRCPFCLWEGDIYAFRIKLKKGYSFKSAECPDCGAKMRMKSLTMDLKPVDYAKWLYEYVKFGGYSKIKWDKLKYRLKQMGIAKTFWEAWKLAKEEAYRLKYGDYEKQYEEYKGGE
jgi:transcription elongation factor Elf1